MSQQLQDSTAAVRRLCWSEAGSSTDMDKVVAETPIALVYNGVSHVVTMATPRDLEDLALGFSLSEGILSSREQLLDCEIAEREQGIELQMTIAAEAFAGLKKRRRNLTGRTGCGLCGLESLAQAVPAPARVQRDTRLTHQGLQTAVQGLDGAQSLKDAHDISRALKRRIREAYPQSDVIIHQDPADI